ncbi:hypothetical protein [Brevibacterium aurantiacum]|uniref:hypothetical protein n=1 Tax=Brevibacterium aurantiacum TaxID=273384 RepID=UPI0016435EF2|nr:hypothetical protein [Brevibacterium aurantiacum]
MAKQVFALAANDVQRFLVRYFVYFAWLMRTGARTTVRPSTKYQMRAVPLTVG